MCGICGFYGSGNENILYPMMNAMSYRGPDAKGTWSDGLGMNLGHLRLSIIDLETGNQPMISNDGAQVIVFNGEIYNHRILRAVLSEAGHKFTTSHSDTEVILNGYKEWGMDVTQKLNGMWAFALFDRQKQLLWLSRDRFGEKPIYYAEVKGEFVFASELTSLVRHPKIVSTLDRLAIKKYFAHGYIPAPNSIIENVKKLQAGHDFILDLQTRESSVRRYWRLELQPNQSLISRPEILKEEIREKLYEAVKIRLEADVPIGVFISGGIDSSAIASLAVSANSGAKIRSFSIGFEDPSFDELSYSSQVASFLDTDHRVEKLTAHRCLDLLDTIYHRLDEPLGDSSLVPSFLMCQLARTSVTVALGGDGADELFAGYDPFKALKPASLYDRFIGRNLHHLMLYAVGKLPVSHSNMSADFKMKRFLSGMTYDATVRNPIWLGTLPPDRLALLFGEKIEIEEIYEEAIEAFNYPDTHNDVDRTLQFYTELYLQNNILVKMDRASMLNSLEVRSPFLDVEFVNLVRQLPYQQKFDGRRTKKILKESLEGLLPKNILNRPKKGFGVPIGQWFRSQSLEIDPTKLEGIVDTDVVNQMNQEHMRNSVDWRGFLWAHYGLERWLRGAIFSR